MEIAPGIVIDESEIVEEFVRSSGPGGQNVNKVATAVQLRFNVRESRSLSDEVRSRLLQIASGQVTDDGVLIIDSRRYRTQTRNREAARRKLADLVLQAARRPKPRRRTRPTLQSQEQRLENKRHRGETKGNRRAPMAGDD